MDSQGFTGTRGDSQGLARTHRDSQGLSGTHRDAQGLTGLHLNSPHLATQLAPQLARAGRTAPGIKGFKSSNELIN